MKKCVNLKKCSTPDECAHTVVELKRHIDNKLYNTGSIEVLLDNFDRSVPDNPNIDFKENFKENFKDRIRYYANNKNTHPKRTEHERYNFCVQCQTHNPHEKNNQLEDVPVRALLGGVEIACGCLISVLPFPGCPYLGTALVSHGISNVYEGYMQKYEQEQGERNRL